MPFGQESYGQPLIGSAGEALQIRAGLGQIMAQRQEQQRIAQIDQAWKASGGDLNVFKSRGGYGLLHPQEAMALEDKLRQRERDAEQSRQFNETNARLKEQAAENTAQRVEDRTVRQVGQIQSRLGAEEALRVRQEEAAANRRSQEIRGIADRNLREQIAAERSAAGPTQGAVPFGWTVDAQGTPVPLPGGPADLEYIRARAEATKTGQEGGYTPESIHRMALQYRATGEKPSISRQDTRSMAEFYNEVARLAASEGDKAGTEQALRLAQYSADKGSLNVSQKSRDATKSFVENMNKQIDAVADIYDKVSRLDTRLVNVPIRTWRKTVAGSGNEAIVDMYLTEISNEIGKISTGSTASIRELSESAQERWTKIHDPNLSMNELMKLLGETKHAGQLRLDSMENILKEIKGRISPEDQKAAPTVVEERIAPDGRKLQKLADGTIRYAE